MIPVRFSRRNVHAFHLLGQLLKSYVAYAKAHCHPKLTLKAARVLQKLYLTMRNEARDGRSMPITMRQLESLVRLSQVSRILVYTPSNTASAKYPPPPVGVLSVCRKIDADKT